MWVYHKHEATQAAERDWQHKHLADMLTLHEALQIELVRQVLGVASLQDLWCAYTV